MLALPLLLLFLLPCLLPTPSPSGDAARESLGCEGCPLQRGRRGGNASDKRTGCPAALHGGMDSSRQGQWRQPGLYDATKDLSPLPRCHCGCPATLVSSCLGRSGQVRRSRLLYRNSFYITALTWLSGRAVQSTGTTYVGVLAEFQEPSYQ